MEKKLVPPDFIITVTATPSLNKMKSRWSLSNWKNKYRRELKGYEAFKLKKNKKAIIEVKRYGSRMYDYDNFAGGAKSLIDLLKEKGLIVDDSPKWLDISFSQVKTKRGLEKTVLMISYKEVK